MPRIIVITGGSSGVGQAIAQTFAAAGDIVYELSRSGVSNGAIIHLDCDLTVTEQIAAAFQTIEEQRGCIDILINNAGIGVSGATEFITEQQARQLMDIDFFGAWLTIKHALPLLRQSASAKIINISSVAAVYHIPFQSFYSAAKAALNALSQALAIELAPFNISVTALMPGDINSGFTDSRIRNSAGEDIYGEAIAKSVGIMEKDELKGMSTQEIAGKVYQLSQKSRLKPLYAHDGKYRFFLFLGKLLPSSIINKILALMYAPPA